MILVVDSGSSDSDWMLNLPDSDPLYFQTKGLNPFFVNEKDIERVMKGVTEIIPYLNEIREVYFFGAGCVSPDRREIVSNAMTTIFPQSFISVESDLLGSAYAALGTEKGFICTLGTGSDISFYNGAELEEGIHGNGFVLGDEGSGSAFGKRLIRDFLYGNMPKDIHDAFDAKFRLTKDMVVKNVYVKDRPNAFLASFAKFMGDYTEHPYIEKVLREGFEDFVQTVIMSYDHYHDYSCNFVGRIAYNFDLKLKEVCQAHSVKVGTILERPINRLYEFITAREGNYIEA